MLNASLILCENCGYDINSLEPRLAADPNLKCPECGKPIAESLPERRVGSPWQRKPSIASWLATNILVALHPRQVWRVVQPGFNSSRNLMEWNFVACAVVWALALRFGSGPAMDRAPSFVVGILVFAGLNLLTLIEWLGIQFFSRPRRWRITSHAAWSIVAHASTGWLLGPPAGVLTWLLADAIGWRGWGSVRVMTYLGADYSTYEDLSSAVALLASLLTFETLTYLGFRAMRFANHPRESTP